MSDSSGSGILGDVLIAAAVYNAVADSDDTEALGQPPPLYMVPQEDLFTKIQLFISCRDLLNVDYEGRSDTMCHILMREQEGMPWSIIEKTETKMNDLNPDF